MYSLDESYERCRLLHRKHGRTYYLATRLLPAWKRRHVHALYGFTRYADEIVDRTELLPVEERARRLAGWSAKFLDGLGGARVTDPLLPAVLHTVRVFDIDIADFRRFLDSMAMDLTVTRYPTYQALLGYMDGSAAAIGTMMLPILGADNLPVAREPARQLGLAFQLTNFIRDVAEDLDRGRVYLPEEDLAQFGVTRPDLLTARANGGTPSAVRALVRYEVARARRHYVAAEPGIALLEASSQPCIRAAYRLYAGILEEVERQDHDVFAGRAVVPNHRRLWVALSTLVTRGRQGPSGWAGLSVPDRTIAR